MPGPRPSRGGASSWKEYIGRGWRGVTPQAAGPPLRLRPSWFAPTGGLTASGRVRHRLRVAAAPPPRPPCPAPKTPVPAQPDRRARRPHRVPRLVPVAAEPAARRAVHVPHVLHRAHRPVPAARRRGASCDAASTCSRSRSSASSCPASFFLFLVKGFFKRPPDRQGHAHRDHRGRAAGPVRVHPPAVRRTRRPGAERGVRVART